MHGLIVKLVFLAASVGLVREAIKWWQRVTLSGKSRAWPCVEGRIEHSEAFLQLGGYRQSRARSGYYIPRIRFAYEVRGRGFTGDVITFGREPIYTSFPARAQAKCSQYPVGSVAKVYFDPDSPSTACLERGAGSLALGYLLAILIAVLGVLALSGVVLF